MKASFHYFTEKEQETINHLSLHFLAEQGVVFQDAKLCQKLAASDVKVEGKRVFFPFSCVEQLLDNTKKTKNTVPVGGVTNRGFTSLIVDENTGVYRKTTLADVTRLCLVANELTGVDFISLPHTDDQAKALQIAVENSGKPIFTPCRSKADFTKMCRSKGDFSCFFFQTATDFETDLCFNLETAAKKKIPFGVFPKKQEEPSLSISEQLLFANIHNLAVFLTAKLLQRKSIVYYCGFPSNRRGSFENVFLNCALGQMAAFYGLPALLFCDGNEKRHFTSIEGFEANMRYQSVQAMIPNAICQWLGSVDFGAAYSLTDLVLDNEVHTMAKGYTREFSADKEHLGAKVVKEVGPGGHFLFHPHTLKHFSYEIWMKEAKDSFIFADNNYQKEAKSRVDALLKP